MLDAAEFSTLIGFRPESLATMKRWSHRYEAACMAIRMLDFILCLDCREVDPDRFWKCAFGD
jgi:hypothetical protein